MADSIKMMKLDWLSLKRYIKQMVFSLAIITLVFLTSDTTLLNVVYFVVVSMLMTYPFMIEEQHGMVRFYAMIATSKKERVRARYLEALIGIGVVTGMIAVVNMIKSLISQAPIDKGLFITLWGVGVICYAVVISIGFPCCFKWGYGASKIILMVLPIGIGFGIPAIAYICKFFVPESAFRAVEAQVEVFLTANTGAVPLAALFFCVISFFISYCISKKIAK